MDDQINAKDPVTLLLRHTVSETRVRGHEQPGQAIRDLPCPDLRQAGGQEHDRKQNKTEEEVYSRQTLN
jgi:hypothetical protein